MVYQLNQENYDESTFYTQIGKEYERTPSEEQRLIYITKMLASGYTLAQLGQTPASYAALKQGTLLVVGRDTPTVVETLAYDQAVQQIEAAKAEAIVTGDYTAAVEQQAQLDYQAAQEAAKIQTYPITLSDAEVQFREDLRVSGTTIQPGSDLAIALENREPVISTTQPGTTILPDAEPIVSALLKTIPSSDIVEIAPGVVDIPSLGIRNLPAKYAIPGLSQQTWIILGLAALAAIVLS